MMIINEEMKGVIENSPFLTIVTANKEGMPHPIIVAKGSVEGNQVKVGVYSMKVTQQNLKENDCAMILAAQLVEGGAKGYRFTGNAVIEDGRFVFTASNAEALI